MVCRALFTAWMFVLVGWCGLSPLVGSPAYRAGLQSGDVIIEIDGQSSADIDQAEAIRRLKGEAGTNVEITLVHPPRSGRRKVTIQREIIHIETVLGDRRDDRDQWDFMLDHDKKIGYIRITSFGRDTFRDLRAAMKELEKQKLRGLIMDLRFNPGGLLASAIEVADLFLTEGEIVSTAGRNSPKRSWSARKPETFEGFPMVVLVNRYSASASEIVSASLQDHKRAIVIGERTWGKGSVQNVIELEDGKSALKLTTASYRRPSGQNIHRFPDSKESDEWGVMPDPGYEIKLGDEELGHLIANRRERDILLVNHSDATKPDASKPADSDEEATKSDDAKKPEAADQKQPEAVDRQLQRAVDYLSNELAKAK
jgi:carboxyl-terminal processing protease